ncbi:MAG: glycosyltransferase family 2 protein [Betaproteobacteria bacterium]|nr:glycosyltransferase family 2 protein [Betaproteobacteria bacterium]
MSAAPLVSLLIPAYRPRFFGEALSSARAQRHASLEIVVGDDSPGEEVAQAVRAAGDPRIRYERHEPALGFAGNFTRLFEVSRGTFVKFLNDDDVLHPDCVPRLLAPLLSRPEAVLATSRRAVIGPDGGALAGDTATLPLMPADGFMAGRALGTFLLRLGVNRIGEPSTVLFRREAVRVEGGSIFRWGANEYECLADLSLWLRLLARGGAWWVAEPLSAYRWHEGQQQRTPGTAVKCILERWLLVEDGARAGFLDAAADHDEAARVAAGVFLRFRDDETQSPELRAALRAFEPRIPARYLAGSGA